MPKRGHPNLACRDMLAAELRRLRDERELTGDDVRRSLGWSASSKLSRIENGVSGVKPADLRDLLDLYQVSGPYRDQIIALAEESRGHAPSARARIPDEHRRLLDAERDAISMQIWEPQVFPGLFQRSGYARAMFITWAQLYSVPPGEVDRTVEARRLRQDVLTRDPPPAISAVIDESVLCRCIGDRAIMSDQLAHILSLARFPGIEIRILPLNGRHPFGSGAFTYYKFGPIHQITKPDLVTFEQLTGGRFTARDEETYQYAAAFDALWQSALPAAESENLISSTLADRWII